MAQVDTVEEYIGLAPDKVVKRWLREIQLADKEEEKWRKRAEKIVKRFRDERITDARARKVNILWSNTTILKAAMYASAPTPDVRPRLKGIDRNFGEQDPQEAQLNQQRNKTVKDTATVLERALSHSIDEYDFDSVIRRCVHDQLLPGRGVARVRYVPIITRERRKEPVEVIEEIVVNTQTGLEELAQRFFNLQGLPVEENQVQVLDRAPEEGESGFFIETDQFDEEVVYEQAVCEYVHWKDYRQSPARIYDEVRWVAYHHAFTRDELKEEFGNEVGGKVKLTLGHNSQKDKPDDLDEFFQKASVWEIWNLEDRKVYFISDGLEDQPVEVRDDPLGLELFFPQPRPIKSVEDNDSEVPIPEFTLYQDQANELDDISKRINTLVKALKVVGVYDASIPALERLMEVNENKLVPVENWSTLIFKGGLEGTIAFVPIKQIAEVLQQLYRSRDDAVNVIHELTGISDIIRGNTDPRETKGAQQLKAQYGNLRLAPRQMEVQRFARDLLRLKAEIMSEQFDDVTLELVSGIPIRPEMRELMENDGLRGLRIDIETDSTIMQDTAQDKKQVNEFIISMTGLIQQLAPLVIQNLFPLEAARALILFAARRVKISKELEDTLEQIGVQSSGQSQPQNDDGLGQLGQIALIDLQQRAKDSDDKNKLKAFELQLKDQDNQRDAAIQILKLFVEQAEKDVDVISGPVPSVSSVTG